MDNSLSLSKKRLIKSFYANLAGRPVILVLELTASVLVARYLGPEMLAILVTVRAMAQIILAITDMGLTNSLTKIVPDLSSLYGKNIAIAVVKDLTRYRIYLAPVALLVLLVMHERGIWRSGISGTGGWIIIISLIISLQGVVNSMRRYTLISAIKTKELIVVDTIIAIFGPILSTVTAATTNDPVLVATSLIVIQFLAYYLMHHQISYDMDTDGGENARINTIEVLKHYRTYIAVYYLKYLFNKIYLRAPMAVIILGMLGVLPSTVSNVAIAISIVFQAWQLANMPLAQLRAPILSRLHLQDNQTGMVKLQRVSISINTLSAGLLAIVILTLGEPILLLLYGDTFSDASRWGSYSAVLGLVGSLFSLGNNTLQQIERYRPQIQGMILSIVISIVMVWYLVNHTRLADGFVVLLSLVTARVLFWLYTDVMADYYVSRFVGSIVKLRMTLAVMVIFVINGVIADYMPHYIINALVGVLLLMAVFRLLGGIGKDNRELFQKYLDRRYWMLLKLI